MRTKTLDWNNQMTEVLTIDSLRRGYLAMNQLTNLLSQSHPHVEATVVTDMSAVKRSFSWIWDGVGKRPVLANLITGTLFCPISGKSLHSSPFLAEAPIPVPELSPGKNLPTGIFSTN